jgi:hypothetical protein
MRRRTFEEFVDLVTSFGVDTMHEPTIMRSLRNAYQTEGQIATHELEELWPDTRPDSIAARYPILDREVLRLPQTDESRPPAGLSHGWRCTGCKRLKTLLDGKCDDCVKKEKEQS